MSPRVEKWVHAAIWLVVALPALYQVLLLAQAVAGRAGYPYDLEWMEGGMLHHALRIRTGRGIYVPPNIDFIPYLYTPLYPTLLALFSNAFGLSYGLGRAFSIFALIGIAITALASLCTDTGGARRGPGLVGTALALGMFAAFYPFVEGWYDLVRADTFFLFMATAAIAGLPRWSRVPGIAGHGKVAAAALLLALSFFCKQTGIFYVVFGGGIVLVVAWRKVPVFVATAAAIGLGGTWLLNHTTDGWFWTYASKIHRAHDFNMDRFWKSFGNIFWHIPALTIVVGAALIYVLIGGAITKRLPRTAKTFLWWCGAFAVSTVVGAVGWGTEFAHFNAYMPAFLHGALAAGAAISAVVETTRGLAAAHAQRERFATLVGLAAAVPLAVACWQERWEPKRFIPTAADVAAGDALIARIRSIPGDVWMPSHPWYLELADKSPHVHRMGIKDVTTRQSRTVEGLDEALRTHVFSALVLDNRDIQLDNIPQLHQFYRAAMQLPKSEQPRVYTGAPVVPDTIWVPAIRATPPAGASVLFDFESPSWSPWSKEGAAWGAGPATQALPGQDLVLGASGQHFATSMFGGDKATGRVSSPPFALAGNHLTLHLGGGTDASKLRVELVVDGATVKTASVPAPGGDALKAVDMDISDLSGKTGALVLIDDSPTGHLDVDDIWVWQ